MKDGIWKRHRGTAWEWKGLWPFRKLFLFTEKIKALHWASKCEMCYDPETPSEALKILRWDEDASVRQAFVCREEVLKGNLKNPFENGDYKKLTEVPS